MSHILLVGEDGLCCALGQRLIAECLVDWKLLSPPVKAGGITRLEKSITRYREAARTYPVLCIADVDRGCPAQISKALRGPHPPDDFIVNLAVREAESWVLADNSAFADFLGIAVVRIPQRPDDEEDPKRTVLNLAKRSGDRQIRREMVSESNPAEIGSGYNLHLSRFVLEHWSVYRATAHSPSLQRAVGRVEALRLRH